MIKQTALFAIIIILTMALVVSAQTLTASPSKNVYQPNEQLVISGKATPGGLVTIIIYNTNSSMVAVDQVKADYNGLFESTPLRFPPQPTPTLPYGDYLIIVKDVVSGEEVSIKVVFARAAIVIKGVVVGYDGGPLANATVTLITPSNATRVSVTKSDGSFMFEESELGTYTILAKAPGYDEERINISIDYAPTTASIVVSMNKPRIWIENYVLMVDNKPFAGYAREGEELKASLQVYFAGQLIVNALVTGKISCTSGDEANLTFIYDRSLGAYTASYKVPSIGQDRTCKLTVEASYGSYRQSVETGFNVFVSTMDLQERIMMLDEKVRQLEASLNKTAVDISSIEKTIAEMQKIIATLNNTQLGLDLRAINETLNTLRKSLSEYATRDDLSNVQAQLSAQISHLQEQVTLLQQAVLTITQKQQGNALPILSLGISIVAVIIALLSILYIYRKIAV